jgi:hypothetical protein
MVVGLKAKIDREGCAAMRKLRFGQSLITLSLPR